MSTSPKRTSTITKTTRIVSANNNFSQHMMEQRDNASLHLDLKTSQAGEEHLKNLLIGLNEKMAVYTELKADLAGSQTFGRNSEQARLDLQKNIQDLSKKVVQEDLHHKQYQKTLLSEISDLKARITSMREQSTKDNQKHLKQMDEQEVKHSQVRERYVTDTNALKQTHATELSEKDKRMEAGKKTFVDELSRRTEKQKKRDSQHELELANNAKTHMNVVTDLQDKLKKQQEKHTDDTLKMMQQHKKLRDELHKKSEENLLIQQNRHQKDIKERDQTQTDRDSAHRLKLEEMQRSLEETKLNYRKDITRRDQTQSDNDRNYRLRLEELQQSLEDTKLRYRKDLQDRDQTQADRDTAHRLKLEEMQRSLEETKLNYRIDLTERDQRQTDRESNYRSRLEELQRSLEDTKLNHRNDIDDRDKTQSTRDNAHRLKLEEMQRAYDNTKECYRKDIASQDKRHNDERESMHKQNQIELKAKEDFLENLNKEHQSRTQVQSATYNKELSEKQAQYQKDLKKKHESHNESLKLWNIDKDNFKTYFHNQERRQAAVVEKMNQTHLAEVQQKNKDYEKLRLDKDTEIRKLHNAAAMTKSMQTKIINEQTETINGLTQSCMTVETKVVSLEAELKRKIDVENQLSVCEKHRNELLIAKDKVQIELESASDFIAELEEKFFKSQETALELLRQLKECEFQIEEEQNEIEVLKQYIIDLKSRIAVYIPVKNDLIDKRLAEYINNYPDRQKLKIMFMRESDGVYQFGTKRVHVRVDKDRINIRVGGGYLSIDEFLDQYTPAELEKLERKDPLKRFSEKVAVQKTLAGVPGRESSPVRKSVVISSPKKSPTKFGSPSKQAI